jgi:DNA-binding NtrC family response regulator
LTTETSRPSTSAREAARMRRVEPALLRRGDDPPGDEMLGLALHRGGQPEHLFLERREIERALQAKGGNKSQTAAYLRIPRHILTYRIEKYGIQS